MKSRQVWVGAICFGMSVGPIGACKRAVRGCVRPDTNEAVTGGAGGETTTLAAGTGAPSASAAPAPLPPLAPLGAHPRIALTPERIARLKKLAKTKAPSWIALERTCNEAGSKKIPSGYEAWDWSLAALSCAMVHRTTGDQGAGRTGVTYLTALFDDKLKVGDGEGGDTVIRHDSGYPIRTRGFLGAVACDWLHDAPGMTPELRKRALDRLVAWVDWYGREGYMRDKPIANYYAGYFGAVAMAGAAFEGDDPRGAELRKRAQRMFVREITPAFQQRLEGGQWPESWQYGAGPAVTLALYTVTERVTLPWLAQVLPYRVHALQPDGVHLYDNGDWSEKPAVANAAELDAVALAFDGASGKNASLARQARALAAKAARKKDDPFGWLSALVDDPDAPVRPEDDPRRDRTSYLAAGTGTLFARTAWTPDAVWLAFQSGPHFSDHQHLDQGHFAVTRGADALLIDPSAYGSGSSLGHNTLLIDDGKEGLPYAPNQVPERVGSKLLRFDDDGAFVHVLGDFTSAYEPPRFADDGKRTVSRAERELIFSRSPIAGGPASARLVIYDRVTVSKPTFGVTWAAHTAGTIDRAGATARVAAGRSVAAVTTMVPTGVEGKLVTEPAPANGENYWTINAPAKGMTSTRLEIPSPLGTTERRFLHVVAVTDADAEGGVAPVAIRGEGADGAALDGEAYVFVRDGVQEKPARVDYVAPEDAPRHRIAGLAPRATYAVTVERATGGCHVRVEPGASGVSTSAGGVALLALPGCALAPK